MSRHVLDAIADMAVNAGQPVVTWTGNDGVRRWNIGCSADHRGLTDREAVLRLYRKQPRRCSKIRGGSWFF